MEPCIAVNQVNIADFNAGEHSQINLGGREYPVYVIKGDQLYGNYAPIDQNLIAQDDRLQARDNSTGKYMSYRPDLLYMDIQYYGMEDGQLYAVTDKGEKLPIELSQGGKTDSLYDRTFNLKPVTQSYDIETHEGKFKDLTFNKLLMLVTLQRSEQMERIVLNRSTVLFDTTRQIELSNSILKYFNDNPTSVSTGTVFPATDINSKASLWTLLTKDLEIPAEDLPPQGTWDRLQILEAFKKVNDKQDEFNSIAQTTLIDIEAFANRRDEIYSLATNAIKQTMNNNISMARNF